jgi:hypothetical protein
LALSSLLSGIGKDIFARFLLSFEVETVLETKVHICKRFEFFQPGLVLPEGLQFLMKLVGPEFQPGIISFHLDNHVGIFRQVQHFEPLSFLSRQAIQTFPGQLEFLSVVILKTIGIDKKGQITDMLLVDSLEKDAFPVDEVKVVFFDHGHRNSFSDFNA